MAKREKSLRVCSNGHRYYKSSDCPVCPQCEQESRDTDDWLHSLSSPARRAIRNAGIGSVTELASFTEKEILDLHGIGPSALPKLNAILSSAGLQFSPANPE